MLYRCTFIRVHTVVHVSSIKTMTTDYRYRYTTWNLIKNYNTYLYIIPSKVHVVV